LYGKKEALKDSCVYQNRQRWQEHGAEAAKSAIPEK
jgi:hypothetical protein